MSEARHRFYREHEAAGEYPHIAVEVCGKCRLPIASGETNLRLYSLYRAHSEQRCVGLLTDALAAAQKDAKAARDALEHNLGIANGTARKAQAERDDMIRTLRKSYSAIQIAEMVGLTRQRVHQILNESSEPDCEVCPGPAFVRQHGGTCCQL